MQTASRMGNLVTFGYAKAKTAAGLADLLAGFDVAKVVDVRLKPFSRDPAWSTRTRSTIEAAGFEYESIPDLGNVAYKTGGVQIRRIDAVDQLLPDLAAGRTLALMCVCYSPVGCHRQVIADEVQRRFPEIEVHHL